jgi:hypothetical protein
VPDLADSADLSRHAGSGRAVPLVADSMSVIDVLPASDIDEVPLFADLDPADLAGSPESLVLALYGLDSVSGNMRTAARQLAEDEEAHGEFLRNAADVLAVLRTELTGIVLAAGT